MIAALLFVVAQGAEPPPRPSAPVVVESTQRGCADAVELGPGESRDCLSVSLPLQDVAYYLAEGSAYTHLRSLYRIDTSELVYQAADGERRAEWWEARYNEAVEPVPMVQRPAVAVAVGVIVGLGTTLLAAKSLQAVAASGEQ